MGIFVVGVAIGAREGGREVGSAVGLLVEGPRVGLAEGWAVDGDREGANDVGFGEGDCVGCFEGDVLGGFDGFESKITELKMVDEYNIIWRSWSAQCSDTSQ